ncbi:hypothetical protein T02_11773 [Trichinella nativa]|uniref:Uncharacterized protein n=1 Tax=Trichinella nativa TaxID=6335 RepID=A0A0V1L2F3_9BILA|nr:hypothetical protein T02_11773 [Trichinella nativa]
MLLYLYGEWKLSGTSDPEEEEVSISVSLSSLTSPLKSHHCTTLLQYLAKYAFVRLFDQFWEVPYQTNPNLLNKWHLKFACAYLNTQESSPSGTPLKRLQDGTSDAEEEEELATPSAARLLLYSYVQRNVACALYELRIAFDYCSLHVSTVISYVSTVPVSSSLQVVSVQWNYFYVLEYLSLMVVRVSLNGLKRCTKICKNGLHYQHRARSYSCVSLRWLNGVTQYWSRNLCGFAYYRNTSHKSGSAFGEYFCRIRNHVDKYVITKHYYQLMPLSLATRLIYAKRTAL